MRSILLIILWGSVFMSLFYIYENNVNKQPEIVKEIIPKPSPVPVKLETIKEEPKPEEVVKTPENFKEIEKKNKKKKDQGKENIINDRQINDSDSGTKVVAGNNKNAINIKIISDDFKGLIQWLNNNRGFVILDDGRYKSIYHLNTQLKLKKISMKQLQRESRSKVFRKIDLSEINQLIKIKLPKNIRRAIFMYPHSIWNKFVQKARDNDYRTAIIRLKIINKQLTANIETVVTKTGKRVSVSQQIKL